MSLKEIGEKLDSLRINDLSLLSVVSAIGLYLLCLIAIKIAMAAVRRVLKRSSVDEAVKGFIAKVVRAALWAVAIIMIASQLGVDTASLVALVSLAGLALSLSLQGVLGNIFSGMTILGARPFTAGDFVELAEVSGFVKKVGLFYTTLTMADNKTVHIPNGQVTSSLITNFTEQGSRRVDLSFGIEYEAEADNVKAALLKAASGDDRILSDPAPFAGILSYNDSTVEYVLRVWVKTEDYWDVYFYLNEAAAKALAERGVSMSYPHMRVHME